MQIFMWLIDDRCILAEFKLPAFDHSQRIPNKVIFTTSSGERIEGTLFKSLVVIEDGVIFIHYTYKE